MDKRILLVEDDESLGFVTRDNLQHRGYQVELCTDGALGLETFAQQPFDICILDVMLPKMDGFTLAEKIRQSNASIPIIFLTAKGLQEDKLKGFKMGGDDYITKPFSMDELVFRIEVFLRRSRASEINTSTRKIGQLTFEIDNMSVTLGDESLKLTRRETEILTFLLDRQNQIVKREEILLALWGDNDYFKGRSLDVFISKLRKCLKMDPALDIENYHGVGFKLKV